MRDDGFDSWMRTEGFVTPENDYGDRAFCYPENAFQGPDTIEPTTQTKKENQLLNFLKELRAKLVEQQKRSKALKEMKDEVMTAKIGSDYSAFLACEYRNEYTDYNDYRSVVRKGR